MESGRDSLIIAFLEKSPHPPAPSPVGEGENKSLSHGRVTEEG